MKIFVAVPCSEHPRSHPFYVSLASQQLPGGAAITPPVPLYGTYIGNNQNVLAQMFLKTNCTHFWLTNDDQTYPPDTLAKLLSHDADIAVPLCLARNAPFLPLLYRQMGAAVVQQVLERNMGRVLPVAAAGGGGMLIKRKVLETIAYPWWETNTIWVGGQPKMMTEDIDFCRKVHAAGFKMICDLEAAVGHDATFTLWPGRNPDGSWFSAVQREQATIRMDQPTQDDLEAMTRKETVAATSA